MKIRITKKSKTTMWYDLHVGEEFEIDERKTTDDYYVVKSPILRVVKYVYKTDCIVLLI